MMKKHIVGKCKKLVTVVAIITTLLSVNMIVFAEESEMLVDIGGIIVDVEKLAEENNVNPYELKEAIENGRNAEKASPFSSLATYGPDAEEKSTTEHIAGMERASTKESKKNQDSTAYVAETGALTASGKTPSLGMCAMHINVTTKSGSSSNTRVKLGTMLYMEECVVVQDRNYSSLIVEDRGNPTNRTEYWIDVYFGLNKETNYNAAINYGIKNVNYYYYY